MSRVVTFIIGIVLVVGAFAGFLFWGSIANPPPFAVVVALRDIAPGQEITQDYLTVDEQIINPRVAQRFVLEGELNQYLGSVAMENIFAGEPLTKLRLVTGNVALRSKRLATALADKRLTAMVLPVSAKSSPSEIVPGDLVDVIWGVGSSGALHTPDQAFPSASIPPGRPSPTPKPQPPQPNQQPAPAAPDAVVLPVAKAILQRVVVARVNFQQLPNPNYAGSASFGGGQQSSREPQFLQGPIDSLVLLVPQETQEMVAFAMSNGDLHVSLLSSQVEPGDIKPLPGVMWSDVLDGMLVNRKNAGQPALDNLDYLLSVSVPMSGTTAISPTVTISPTIPSGASALPVAPAATPAKRP
jgi:Flp pilus assembly protein CpaB